MQTGIHKGIHKTCVIINLTQSLIESLYLGIDYVQKLILKITLKNSSVSNSIYFYFLRYLFFNDSRIVCFHTSNNEAKTILENGICERQVRSVFGSTGGINID